MTVIPNSVARSADYNLEGLGWPQNVDQHQDLGFFQVLLAAGQQALSTVANKISSEAQAKVVKAQTKLENVRSQAAQLENRNRLVMLGVGGAVLIGALFVLTSRRK